MKTLVHPRTVSESTDQVSLKNTNFLYGIKSFFYRFAGILKPRFQFTENPEENHHSDAGKTRKNQSMQMLPVNPESCREQRAVHSAYTDNHAE